MLCSGLAVFCGCCVVGVLVGVLCVSGGWHVGGFLGCGLLVACRGLAVLRGCCVLGVLVGALCASGGWHIAGGVGWMALWVAFWAVMCEWLLAHWADCLVSPWPRADKLLQGLALVAAVCLCL